MLNQRVETAQLNRIIAGVLLVVSMPAVFKSICLQIVAALLARWIGRRLLLALLGVKSTNRANTDAVDRLRLRFQKQRTSHWLFAWFKTRLDPMFLELPDLLESMPPPEAILDIGCGYGIAAGALLEWFPGARLTGIDPSRSRIRVAQRIFGNRGFALCGAAPDLPLEELPDRIDAVFILDVIHYLDDSQLAITLQKVRDRLTKNAWLIIRVSIPEAPSKSIFFRLEGIKAALTGNRLHYRTQSRLEEMLIESGFQVGTRRMSGKSGELCWFAATTCR